MMDNERNMAMKFGGIYNGLALSRSRSAQSLKMLGDTATQVSFTNVNMSK